VLVPEKSRTKDDHDDEDDLGRGESRREGLCVETIDQAGQHRYDTREHLLARKNTIAGNQSFGDGRIEASGALKCRAAGVIKKLGALATLPFTVPFGRIEKHRKTRAVKLFDQLASILARRLRNIVEKGRNPSNEPEFDAIDIEFFVIKKRIHRSE
jgi:hypothetical protein